MTNWTHEQLQARLVRYADLVPSYNAFIDAHTPGSDQKENFTIIGGGVAEHPDKHVHISIPHGFNIGGARQPPHCVNSQHSHDTEEVFVVHTGRWAFRWGHDASDGEAILGPGDCISIPVNVFRGFENVGDETGFLFAILGGDDPGQVIWAPYVFEAAKGHGLVLLENGQLVDTSKGETIPKGVAVREPTPESSLADFRRMTVEEMLECVQFADQLGNAAIQPISPAAGVLEYPIVGLDNPRENIGPGKLAWAHGFHVRRVEMAPNAEVAMHSRDSEEVIFVHQGSLRFCWPEGEFELGVGDMLTVPLQMPRSFINLAKATIAYVVRGGDQPGPAEAIQTA